MVPLRTNFFAETDNIFGYRRNTLLTKGEHAFYEKLRVAVGRRYHIAPKVRLADVLFVPGNLWARFGRPICQKHLDFVLCDPETMEVLFAIELDDSSHDNDEAMKKDDFKDQALRVAGIWLLRFRAKYDYTAADIATAIDRALRMTPTRAVRRPRSNEKSRRPAGSRRPARDLT